MMRCLRRSDRFLALLLLSGGLFCVSPIEASDFRYANIHWCAATEDFQQPTTNTITFFVQIAKSLSAEEVGDTVFELFDFGDGTSTLLALTVTEVHPDEDWFLAKGEVVHRFAPTGDSLLNAGIEGCCRIDGTAETDGLNNRNGEPYRVKVLVSRTARAGACSPRLFVPPIVSLYIDPAVPGVEYLVPVSSSTPFLCRLASDSEAGGGPSPSGMRLGSGNCIIDWGMPSDEEFPFWTAQVIEEGYEYHPDFEFGPLFSSAAADFLLRFLSDLTPPVCRVDHLDPGPPTQLFIFVQDAEAGLSEIQVLQQTNATVFVPSSARGGYKGSVIVVGTKIDQSQPAQIRLRVRDLAGNVTECDPVLTGEARAAGRPESHVFSGIPPEEHVVTVFNGDPGLLQIHIDVNGRKFTVAGLRAGEERTIDVGSAIVSGVNSTFTLTSHGKPGGSATIMIWDGRSE